MLKKQYTEKDVANLIAQVEEAFTSQLAKVQTSLAKSEDGEMPPKKEHEEEHEEKPKHEAKEHAPEAHEGKEEHDEEHGPEGEEHEGHDYDEEDMAHMEKMYRSMSKGEQKAHHGCLSKCMGMGMAKAEIESCEPKDTPGAKSPASNSDSSQMKKADGCGGEM
jgi:catalase